MHTRLKHILTTIAALVMLMLPTVGTTPAQAHSYTSTPQANSIAYNALYAPLQAASKVTITKYPGTVGRGYTASISVKTAPQASCSIAVYYKSGASVAAGLYSKSASASGVASWSWKVGGNTTRGAWPVVVTCNGVVARTSVTVP